MKLNPKDWYITLVGLVQSSFALKRYAITTPTCLQILNNAKDAPTESVQQAHLYLGKIAMQRAEHTNAKHHFLKATTPLHTNTAAEAQYLLACTAFKLKAYKSALQALFALIEQFPQHKPYIDQAFLLMVDIYIILGKFTQAKATLDSIIDQSKDKKTIELAKKKRSQVVAKLNKPKA